MSSDDMRKWRELVRTMNRVVKANHRFNQEYDILRRAAEAAIFYAGKTITMKESIDILEKHLELCRQYPNEG